MKGRDSGPGTRPYISGGAARKETQDAENEERMAPENGESAYKVNGEDVRCRRKGGEEHVRLGISGGRREADAHAEDLDGPYLVFRLMEASLISCLLCAYAPVRACVR